jgi:hypothetical protein
MTCSSNPFKWIGTHKDYDKINVNEVEHER